MKKIFIRTFGCQMNESDSDVMAGLLEQRGYTITDSENDADVILLNTCSVRASAENKAIGKMRELGKLKDANPNLILGFCGCMAQKDKELLFKKLPFLDIVCGTNSIHKLPDLIEQASLNRRYLIDVTLMDEYPVREDVACSADRIKAWVPIMRGCDNYCSYCVVPYVRGKEISRPAEDILNEIEKLAKSGYKEVTLLGQNVNSYNMGQGSRVKGQGRNDFVRLLEKINEINGLERIRFVTSHPKDISDELIAQFGKLSKLCEYLHFPIQSGSDRILKLMNRGYTAEHYIGIVEKLRKQCPQIALGTDIIVGFPNETEEDFQKTVEVLETIEYDSAYIFKYSTRTGTAAASLKDDVPQKIKEERNCKLLELQEKISLKKNQELLGKTVEILVEGPSARNPERLMGRTRRNQIAVFEAENIMPGSIVNKEVKRVTPLTLYC